MTTGQVIAIDGKTVRRSHDRGKGKKPLHLVSAWASANELAIGQRKIEDKSNEITAIPELLNLLDIRGCIVTIDAMGTQKEIAKAILGQKADYVLAVKRNQGRLYEDIRHLFKVDREDGFKGSPFDHARTVDKGHGRIEIRECWVTADPEYLEYIDPDGEWEGLGSIAVVKATRKIGEKETSRGAISSPVWMPMRRKCSPTSALTGRWRTNFIGVWMWFSKRMRAAFARVMPLEPGDHAQDRAQCPEAR